MAGFALARSTNSKITNALADNTAKHKIAIVDYISKFQTSMMNKELACTTAIPAALVLKPRRSLLNSMAWILHPMRSFRPAPIAAIPCSLRWFNAIVAASIRPANISEQPTVVFTAKIVTRWRIPHGKILRLLRCLPSGR